MAAREPTPGEAGTQRWGSWCRWGIRVPRLASGEEAGGQGLTGTQPSVNLH